MMKNPIWLIFLNNRPACFGMFFLMFICIACAIAPFITSGNYMEMNTEIRLSMPSRNHPLGTDNFGRDTLIRLLYGGRITLKTSFLASGIASIIGSAIGLICGYYGGKTDLIFMNLVEAVSAIPVFLIVIAVEYVLGWGEGYFFIALAIVSIPQFVRITRSAVAKIKSNEYIEAAISLGVSHKGIITEHILPNLSPLILVRCTDSFAENLVICTIMGFLGVGVSPPMPEWGAMVFDTIEYLRSYPLLTMVPSCAIILTVVSLHMVSDGLQDLLDPRHNT